MSSPPKLLLRLFHVCSPKNRLDDLHGDFIESYGKNDELRGKRMADLRFVLDALSLIPLKIRSSVLQIKNSNLMLKNYFKIAYRNLMKDKSYAAINISGLAIGMVCTFIIFIYIRLELSFDTFHEKADQIYRMQHVYSFIGAPIGPQMVEEYPEVLSCTRIYLWATEVKTIIDDEHEFYEDYIIADNNFFETFSFRFIHGNPRTALTGSESLVITESTARKYFGDVNVVGKFLKTEGLSQALKKPLKVTAVIEDVPYNSHLQFSHVASFDLVENNPNINILDSWINDWITTYVVLAKGADPKPLEDEYWDFFEKHAGVRYPDPFRLMPLTDVRHRSTYLRSDNIEQGNINHIRIFSAVAILVLFIACINYMNLATAKSEQRAKEVGIRKVMGAFKKQLLSQFLVESMAISFIALFLGTIIIWFIFPHLENLTGIRISEGLNDFNQIILIALSVTVFTGLVAGSYPAFYLSSFGASDILKESKNSGKKSGLIRKGLVVLQLSVSMILIIATLVVVEQMNYVSKKDLGFKLDQVIALNYGRQPPINDKWDFLKTEIGNIPGVIDVASTRSIPGDNAAMWNYRFEGDPEDGDGFPGYYIGPNTLDLLDFEMLMGRSFSEKITTDENAFILTEMAWKEAINLYGDDWKNPLGRTIEYSTTNSGDWQVEKKGEVIGVVKDFHFRSLQNPMEALVLQQGPRQRKILVKVEPGQVDQILDKLSLIWPTLGSKKPFSYEFLDQQFADYYESENRFSQLLYAFCGLTLFIASLGLLGLASFSAQRRTKEIGIRKVMGASVPQVFKLITSDFIKLIVLGLLISFPIAWYASARWLENFTYRVDVSFVNFILAAVATFLLTMITISWQSLKAANRNPVESLRHE